MIYTFNEQELNFIRENIKESLKKVNVVRSKVDVENNLYQAYDLLMLTMGLLEGKVLQQPIPKSSDVQ
jgi:hypothetical protein